MKLNAFKFIIQDAFYSKNNGLYGILETSIDSTKIDFIIDGKVYFLKTLNKNEFIKDLLDIGILKWSQKNYVQYHEDGYSWSLVFSYDDIYVETKGWNAYPVEFDSFMDLLHTKYHLPYLSLELSPKKSKYKWHTKGNIVKDFFDEM